MLAKVSACGIWGLDGVIVDVEVDTSQGLPNMTIVGLPDTAVQESRERVHSAIKNSSLEYPRKSITVNLAPASLRKEGPAYDLPIAVGILAATGQIPLQSLETASLSVNSPWMAQYGTSVEFCLLQLLPKNHGFKRIFVPAEDASEAALIPGIEVMPIEDLMDTGIIPTRRKEITPCPTPHFETKQIIPPPISATSKVRNK